MIYDTAVCQENIFSADRVTLQTSGFQGCTLNIFYVAEFPMFCKTKEVKAVAVFGNKSNLFSEQVI